MASAMAIVAGLREGRAWWLLTSPLVVVGRYLTAKSPRRSERTTMKVRDATRQQLGA